MSGTCTVHALPMLVTHSGLQRVCPTYECSYYVRLQGPMKEDSMVKATEKKELTPEERKRAIEEFAAKKKTSTTSDAVVKPAKKPATKIPASANLTTGKPKKAKPTPVVPDEVVDEVVAKKAKKEEKDDDMLSVSDVARMLGIDPKRARAKLRGLGHHANEGRWPKVKRGSKKYQELVDLLKPSDDEAPEDEEGEEDEDGN